MCLLVAGPLVACEDAGLTKVSPVIEVTPSPIVLPATAVGLSGEAAFVVKNRGSATLEVSRVRVEGSRELTVQGSTQALSLAPGEERPLALSFRPTTLTAATASLVLSSNDPDRPELVVPIEAPRRTGPVLVACVASPDVGLTRRCAEATLAVDLGIVALGSVVTATLTLESVGDAPVDLTSLALAPEASPSFTLSTTALPLALAPGARTTALVRFTPAAAGPAEARVVARSSDLVQPTKTLELRALAIMQNALLNGSGT